MSDLVNLFIFNILVMQNDGMPQNWELEESANGVNLTPIFDNEFCLMFNDMGNITSKLTTNYNDFAHNNYSILEEFLKISSAEYISLFLEKFNSLTLEVFIDLIKKIENKIGCNIPNIYKEAYVANFKKNRENIEEVINKMNLNNTRK